MKRSALGNILLALDSAPGLSITGNPDLDNDVLGRLGVQMEPSNDKPAPAAGPAAEAIAPTPEEKPTEEKPEGETEPETETEAEETETEEQAETETAPEFTEEQQAWLNQQNEARTSELTETQEKLEAAEARAQELEEQVTNGSATPLAVAPIHPLFLVDDPTKLEEEDQKLAAFERWALRNWEGTEEIPAQGDKPAVPAYSKEDVRERYAQIREVREKILPAARNAIGDRKKQDTAARKIYPELFEPKRQEFKIAQNLLNLAPGLKAVIPNIYTVIGDALRGEKIRLAEQRARTKPGTKPAARAAAPKLPTRAAPAPAVTRTATAKSKGDAGINVQKFMEGGGDRAALVAALS